MEKIEITCTNNGKTKIAEVMHKTDKYMKVSFRRHLPILFREDVNNSHTGHTAGLEFQWQQKN